MREITVSKFGKEITIKIHPSVRSCLSAFARLPIDEIQSIGGFDGDGKEYEIPISETIKNIKKEGCWGFLDSKKIIHIWYSKNCDKSSLIHLLAHERGHMIRPYHHKKEDLEEMKAETYGDTARFAFQVMQELLP